MEEQNQNNTPESSGVNPSGAPAPAPTGGNNKAIVIILVIVAVLVLLGVVGNFVVKKVTRNIGERVVKGVFEQATGTKIDLSDIKEDGRGGSMTMTGNDGQSMTIGSSTEIPDGFPKEIAIYKKAEIENVNTINISGDSITYTVVLSTKDSFKDVLEFYTTAFSSDGWETIVKNEMAGYASVSAKRTDNEKLIAQASVIREEGEGVTQITITTQVDLKEE